MEDEEGYMALSPRAPVEISIHCAQAKRNQDVSKYKISLGILGVICVILGSAVIVLTMLVFQSGYHKVDAEDINATKYEPGMLKDFKRLEASCISSEMITTHLCELFTDQDTDTFYAAHNIKVVFEVHGGQAEVKKTGIKRNSVTADKMEGRKSLEQNDTWVNEVATCKLCPANWIEERGTCYWFSKEKKNWIMGYHDCSGKKAQMLVIQDAEEMKFIYDIVQEKYPVWIGLNSTPSVKFWTWIDGSTLNQTLIQLLPPGSGVGCGVIKGKTRSEMCTAEFRWICEKEAILL